jgi:hypothetical protein
MSIAARTGVLVIRAWTERPAENLLRARITQTLDVSTGTSVQKTAGSEAEILAIVRSWLREFTGDGGDRE